MNKIKKILKKFLPSKWIAMMKKIYFVPKIILGNYRKQKMSELCKRNVLKIGFLVINPQIWNSLRSLYELCMKEMDVKPYIIVCPDLETGVSYIEYFRKINIDAIDIRERPENFSIKDLDLDLLFQATPYDDGFPKRLRSRCTSKYTKVCYIPYGYYLSPYKHLDIGYSLEFLSNVYAIFVDSDTAEEFCKKKIKQQFVCPLINIFNVGFPRFDLYRRNQKKPAIYTFLWIPRWSLDNINNDGTNFFNYKNKLIEYFILHTDCRLIIRPHPLMFNHFIQKGVMTREDIDDFLKEISAIDNITFDDNLDYLTTFDQSSALIADFSSLIIEFFLTGKPIIYCGNKSEFNNETMEISQHFYDGSTWENLLSQIETLKGGNDIEQSKREKLRNVFLERFPESSAETILRQCRIL